MTARNLRSVAVILAISLLVANCTVMDTVEGWFDSGGKKSKLRGERISVMTIDETLRIDDTLKTVPVQLPPPYKNAEWPEPGGYASNAMYHLEAQGPLRVLWQQDAGKGSDKSSRLTAAPIIADGRIYVLDSAAHVYAFDANTGAPLWNHSLAPVGKDDSWLFGLFGNNGKMDPTKGYGGGVCYDDGKLFATSGFGEVVALDAKTGKKLWSTDLGVPIVNAPAANGGRVFVSSHDNHFVALAETDGRKLWDHQGITESAGILESTSAAVAGEYVMAPYSSGEIYALRVTNGRPAWNDMLTHSGVATALSELDDIAGRPVVDRDEVFAISHSGIMAAISLNTGDRLWSRDIGGIQTPWAAGDYVYVLTTDEELICLTRKEGKVKWIHQLQRWDDPDGKHGAITWSGPVLVSDRLVVVSSTGVAAAVSPYTGELMAKMEIPAGTYIAPVVANDTLYLYTSEAQLVALR
ncbi:MAG TPA: PQQ-binding-like beta-propeller repeat protein [Rhizomicrobium sp.]|jgi:outer membrane protein assembly factor BamB|nr:PQQ-binding-like beta-propeller repeat protein [Rhizomicrobium sp.]